MDIHFFVVNFKPLLLQIFTLFFGQLWPSWSGLFFFKVFITQLFILYLSNLLPLLSFFIDWHLRQRKDPKPKTLDQLRAILSVWVL